jgi:hypothetical protein
LISCERKVLEWANEMVTRWSGALTENRCNVVTVVLDNCRSVADGVAVLGVEVVGWQGRLNKLRIPNDDGFIFVDHWLGWWRSRKNAWWWWSERCNLAK